MSCIAFGFTIERGHLEEKDTVYIREASVGYNYVFLCNISQLEGQRIL